MVNDEVSDLERQRDRYQTEMSAIKGNTGTKEGGESANTTIQNMINSFNELELARATEADVHKRRYTRKGSEGEDRTTDYAAIIADMEEELSTLEIRPEDKTRIITALKTKYNVQ